MKPKEFALNWCIGAELWPKSTENKFGTDKNVNFDKYDSQKKWNVYIFMARLLHSYSIILSKEKSSNGHGHPRTHLSPGVFKRNDYK